MNGGGRLEVGDGGGGDVMSFYGIELKEEAKRS